MFKFDMKKRFAIAGTLVATAFVLCSVAQAGTSPSLTFSVTGWAQSTPGDSITSPDQQAVPGNPMMIPANVFVTGTATGLPNWFVGSGQSNTFSNFIGNGGTTNSFSYSGSGASTILSSGNFDSASILELTFTADNSLTATITHDDGISLFNVSSLALANDLIPVGDSAPTTAVGTNISIGAGTYDLFYVEANGAPSELSFSNVKEAPEPGALALFGAGLLGCALFVARRRRVSRGS